MDNITNAYDFRKVIEPLPCPFCGSKEIMSYAYDTKVGRRFGVMCSNCMTNRDPGYWQQRYTAVNAWNERA